MTPTDPAAEPEDAVDRIEAILQPRGRCTDCGGGESYWKHGPGDPMTGHHMFQPPRPSDRPAADRVEEALSGHEAHEVDRLTRGRALTEAEIGCYLADHQTALRHATARVGDEIAEQLRDRLDAFRSTAPATGPGLDAERLAIALHETAGRNHNLGEGLARAICQSAEAHLARATAILAALRAATEARSTGGVDEVGELREALEPFRDEAERWLRSVTKSDDNPHPMSEDTELTTGHTIGDWTRLARALATQPERRDAGEERGGGPLTVERGGLVHALTEDDIRNTECGIWIGGETWHTSHAAVTCGPCLAARYPTP